MALKRPLYSMAALATLVTTPLSAAEQAGSLDLGAVFRAAPIIYSLLIALSIASLAIWMYSLLTLRYEELVPSAFVNQVRQLLAQGHFEGALQQCQEHKNFCSTVIASGIGARKHGAQVMMDAMQAEGRRSGSRLWQRISFLSEIAVIAPMLGLLGTVLGLFFAFYDTARTPDSVFAIFDGLGIAIGTTVTGLIVAIMATAFYSSLKFRLVALLNAAENEILSLVNLIELEDSAKQPQQQG